MNYADVTIEKFQQLAVVQKIHDGNPFLIGANIINIFEGIPVSEIKQWSVKQFQKAMKSYEFLSTEIPEDKWVTEFECHGVTYKPVQQVHKWNVGQYVSMSNLTRSEDDVVKNLHIIVAVMCSQDDNDVQSRSEVFQKHLPISVAYPLALFFCAVILKLPKNILPYLKVEVPTGSD